MDFILFCVAVVLFIMLFSTRSRVAKLDRELQSARNTLDWLIQQGAERSAREKAAPVSRDEHVPAAQAPVPREVVPPDAVPTVPAPPVARPPAPTVPAAPAAPPDQQWHSVAPAPVPPVWKPKPQLGPQPGLQPKPEPQSEPQSEPPPEPQSEPQPEPQQWTEPRYAPSSSTAGFSAITTWLFKGNPVAKLGLLILFIGVSFLLKYAAERVTVPIELRLAGIVLADIGLLLWGWRIRERRRDISLPVQGAALGILMLVTFGAFRLYHLIPSSMAFGLLFALTAFTCLLSVLQNAVWLAVFGIVGGFVSPILTSTGQGSHIALFSYYALLNAGILAIAVKRAWRALNLLGFAFTFVIGTAWGVLKYAPGTDYLSTQLFLLLFFAYYVSIALLFAARQDSSLKNYVDATLVFGTPLVAFGLQLGLMKDRQFGNAFSALGFGMFYAALALLLWRRHGTRFKMLVESFLAMGLVFGTLALPFALDGRWTSAAWALEGAGVVWIGLRQKQPLTWMFGLLVQVGAWFSFIGAISGLDPVAAQQSNLWLGFLLLAGTAFFMATNFRRQLVDDREPVFPLAASFLVLATIWLMAGTWTEIFLRTSGVTQANLLAASGLAVGVLLAVIAARLQWTMARSIALAAQVVAGAELLYLAVTQWGWFNAPASLSERPLLGALLIGAGACFSSYQLQRHADNETPHFARPLLAWSAFWWFGPILNALSGYLAMATSAHFSDAGWSAIYASFVAASALAFAWLARRLRWDALRWLSVSNWIMLVLSLGAALWLLFVLDTLPTALEWSALAAVLIVGEALLRLWPASGWRIAEWPLRLLHLVRSAGPWLMLWKVGELLISRWLGGSMAQRALLADSGWVVSGSWANYLPAWAMVLVVAWLIRRSSAERWPVAPIAGWYRQILIPAATLGALLVAVLWNLRQNGAMAPLPYVPVLNPLDLSSAFALLLGVACYRMMVADTGEHAARRQILARVPMTGAVLAYLWFNLMLLRSASHYLGIDYRFGAMFASQFVQAMLCLVWSVTALLLMRLGASGGARSRWITGGGLLALVVAKLFLVDLSDAASMGRIVSFVGVGLLMVAIGYLAPFPSKSETTAQAAA
ncbi:MAG: DUF2339 domain-containing protein [Massilia sp.]